MRPTAIMMMMLSGGHTYIYIYIYNFCGAYVYICLEGHYVHICFIIRHHLAILGCMCLEYGWLMIVHVVCLGNKVDKA